MAAKWDWIPASRVNPMVCESSEVKTADALIHTGKALITGIRLLTDGTNDANIKVYDAVTATGNPKDEWDVRGSELYGGAMFHFPLGMETGIYIDLTGTGAKAIIFYVDLED